MKPYLLFAGSDYYPEGSVGDLQDDFESLEAAAAAGVAYCAKDPDYCKWWSVVRHATMEEVAHGESKR